jgi:predicted ABC-type ATPase
MANDIVQSLLSFSASFDPIRALVLCDGLASRIAPEKWGQNASNFELNASGVLSDKHSDDNYRYKDVGYVSGSRKELAQNSILLAKKSGLALSVTDIDWNAIEEDGRIAESLINKANVFGEVDWEALREGGMNGNVGFFIKRLYMAVAKEPLENTPEDRRLFVTGIQNIRDRFEQCKTYEDILDATIAVSKLLNMRSNTMRDADGKVTLNFDSMVTFALGKSFRSWIFNTGNKALYECNRMKVDDWSWLDKKLTKKKTEERVKPFQLLAATTITRKGGKEIVIQSSTQLKDMFGFSAIQSGNWVLKDKDSAEFHFKKAAEAMSDMSDITGIPTNLLGFGGRLALAFGARGKTSALAHYEPSLRVINITKMKGGGSLGHEYFHALDNLMHDMLHLKDSGTASHWATENASNLPDGIVKEAFVKLTKAMVEGDEPVYETIALSDKDFSLSEHNMSGVTANSSGIKGIIFNAGNASDAVKAVDLIFRNSMNKNHVAWRKIAAAFYSKDNFPIVKVLTDKTSSKFLQDAIGLDKGKVDSYWSKKLELAARAYSAYLDDSLAAKDRVNDYLAFATHHPEAYPQENERKVINAAFDQLFAALKQEKVFEKATGNAELMDSIFGLGETYPSQEIDLANLVKFNMLITDEIRKDPIAALKICLGAFSTNQARQYVSAIHFNAEDYAKRFTDANVNDQKILSYFPPDTENKMQVVSAEVKATPSTDVMYKLENGEYTPERKELQSDILFGSINQNSDTREPIIPNDYTMRKYQPKKGERPIFIMLGGRGGSGKSRFAGMVYNPPPCLVLDADSIKERLPEYAGWNAGILHEESSELLDSALDFARNARVNVVLDATMRTAESAIKKIKAFKDAGYRIEAHYMFLPRQEAAKRAVERFLNPESGRFVPINVVLSNTTNEDSFEQVKPYCDAWSFRDNNVPRGSDPILISSSD